MPEIPDNVIAYPETGCLHALLSTVAFARISNVAFIRVTGEDRVRWLNGMVTNSIVALNPGQGCYCFFLNAQGRIQGDATVWLLEDCILLETALDRVSTLQSVLDRFIIMDDVELQLIDSFSGLLLAGPQAGSLLAGRGFTFESRAGLAFFQTTFQGSPVYLLAAYSRLVPRFEVWTSPDIIIRITALLKADLREASSADLEQLRILEGTPRYGIDIRERELPQETGQNRALHFSKGCYLGQEIVERIRSRGNVHRTLSGFRLNGATPSAGTSLFAADAPDKPIGELTSVATIDLPSGAAILALGYVRRDALERSASITYTGGVAEPSALPFPIDQISNRYESPLPAAIDLRF